MISNKGADYIIEQLEKNGYECYYVGGCVRNAYLNIKIDDYDLTTSATPDEICNLFSSKKLLTVGKKHGTICVEIDGNFYEITTFRTDLDYINHRAPQSVEFCATLEEDLSRRDFTINAMAFNKKRGVIDNFNGINDCKNKILRCVGNPFERFEEDALRILRGIRFASVYGLKVDELTAKAMHDKKSLLNAISKERVLTELTKILLGKHASCVLEEFWDIFCEIIPELAQIKNKKLLYNAISLSERDVNQRFALLFIENAKQFSEIALKLKFSNELKNKIALIYENIEFTDYTNPTAIKLLMCKIDKQIFDLLSFKRTLAIAQNSNEEKNAIEAAIDCSKKIIDNNECYSISQLAINGNHLQDAGYKGQIIGEMLNFALNCVILGKISNDTSKLLNLIKKNYE